MKKLLIPIILCLASCSGYVKVDDKLYQHGAVPQTNPVKSEQVIIDKKSNYAFWLVYTPILLGVVFLAWKTYKSKK